MNDLPKAGSVDMSECLFCKMVEREITPDVVFENDDVLAFRDISPQAPVHVLVIPKKHIATVNDLTDEDESIVGRMILGAREIAHQEGIADAGYRTVMNCNADGGQAVFHIHLHLLGGRQLGWPPG
jgi:histidine triad (HIT) family protein